MENYKIRSLFPQQRCATSFPPHPNGQGWIDPVPSFRVVKTQSIPDSSQGLSLRTKETKSSGLASHLLYYQNKILGWLQFCPSISGSFYRKKKNKKLFGLTATRWCLCFTDTLWSAELPGQKKNPSPSMLTAAKLWGKPGHYFLLFTYSIPQDLWFSHHRKHCQE